MPHYHFIIAAIGLVAGCQHFPRPGENVADCRAVIGRFEAALNAGDRMKFDRSVFCADELEASFRQAMFDLVIADQDLEWHGRETFGDEWSSIKEKAGLKSDAVKY